MKILSTGIDWKNAKINQREMLSFTPNTVQHLIQKIKAHEGVYGCVLLSTCNRTELYLSVDDDFALRPDMLLCAEAGVFYEPIRNLFKVRADRKAVKHLMEVSCGLCSQILGEDQIVTQVKAALQLARDVGTADSVLQTLFRTAVTAGKEAKTQVRLTTVPLSVAKRSVELLEAASGGLCGKKVVVIGNGEMGRLASALLVQCGCDVTVTLRSYRHGETIVPRGCKTASYDARMSAVDGCDILLSATTSPHFTVALDDFMKLENRPKYVADLAMPRDIQPEISGVEGVSFFDMDSMGTESQIEVNEDKIGEIEEIIDKNMQEFYKWWDFKNSLPIIESIKETAVQRALSAEQIMLYREELDVDQRQQAEEMIAAAVQKTVDILLGGMKEAITPELLAKCNEKMIKKMPSVRAVRKVR